jgi:hypothetical protein
MDNTIGSNPAVGLDYAARLARKSMDQQKQEGEAAVQLIETAGKTADPDGKGAHIDTYA